ncbi:MAG: hypothetical protein ACOC5A_05885, partial [Halanaerobiales bacterium]
LLHQSKAILAQKITPLTLFIKLTNCIIAPLFPAVKFQYWTRQKLHCIIKIDKSFPITANQKSI